MKPFCNEGSFSSHTGLAGRRLILEDDCLRSNASIATIDAMMKRDEKSELV